MSAGVQISIAELWDLCYEDLADLIETDDMAWIINTIVAAHEVAPALPEIHRETLQRFLERFDFGEETP